MENYNINNSCDTKNVGKKPETNQLRQFIIAICILLVLIICVILQFVTNQYGFIVEDGTATKVIGEKGTEHGQKDAIEMSLYMIEGFIFGYVLSRAFFGFTGAFTKPVQSHDFSTSKAVLILLLVSTFAITFTQFGINSATNGEPFMNPAYDGEGLHGYDNSLTYGNAISFSLILGGLLFGVGMTYATGCASGVLSDAGEGNARSFIAILGFMIGGFVGIMFTNIMTSQDNWMGVGPYIAFWDTMGLIGGMLFNVFLIFMVYLFLVYLEKRWGNKDKIKAQKDFIQNQNDMYDELRARFIKNEKLSRTYYSLFTRNYSLITGALLIAVIGITIYTATGGFGVSKAYAMWPAYIWSPIFGDVSNNSGFIGPDSGWGLGLIPIDILLINNGFRGFWHDTQSWQDIMILFGALFAVLMAGKFKFKFNNLSIKRFFIFLSGGFLMGFGTRIGGGCNIGSFYDPIITTSLSGYVFAAMMLVGSLIAYQSLKIIDPQSLPS